jgi:hypothetical protein
VSLASGGCQDGVAGAETEHADLQPEDERTALVQRLDQCRAIARAALMDLRWEEVSTRLLPATDQTMRASSSTLAQGSENVSEGGDRFLGGLRVAAATGVLNSRLLSGRARDRLVGAVGAGRPGRRCCGEPGSVPVAELPPPPGGGDGNDQ